jgi:protein-L-isoaspartate(D-aspartate) O-methyltransferase
VDSDQEHDLAAQRRQMVDRWIEDGSISDARVLAAMAKTPRELFVGEELQAQAYEDGPLPIGSGQTISQPYIVARMIEALELTGDEVVLEIGTGSGYAAAVLSRLAREVQTLERIERLARLAEDRLRAAGCSNVKVHWADGSRGWAPAAPYGAIIVAAAGSHLPPALMQQLAQAGRLVMPVGDQAEQLLVRVRRVGDRFDRDDLGRVRFVPLISSVESMEEAADDL